jgi:hypothetical protein
VYPSEILDHSPCNLALAHEHCVATQILQVLNLIVQVRARKDSNLRVQGSCAAQSDQTQKGRVWPQQWTLRHTDWLPRNAYFSSSDAAFGDRYQAETAWEELKAGRIAVDGGWRIYSSGPGLYASVLLRQAFGRRRYFGARSTTPLLPCAGKAALDILMLERRDFLGEAAPYW